MVIVLNMVASLSNNLRRNETRRSLYQQPQNEEKRERKRKIRVRVDKNHSTKNSFGSHQKHNNFNNNNNNESEKSNRATTNKKFRSIHNLKEKPTYY